MAVKKKVWLSALSMGVLLSGGGMGAGAQEASPSSPTSVEFVGVTPVSFKPGWGGGLVPFLRACQASFSGSHVCSSQEILQSGKFPTFPAGLQYPYAWVMPSIVSVVPDPNPYQGNDHILVDASGEATSTRLSSSAGMSCKLWKSSKEWGLTVNSSGDFYTAGCGNSLPVACCAGKAAQ